MIDFTKTFIHTFSMKKRITQDEFDIIKKVYVPIFNRDEKIFFIDEYVEKGVRLEIRNRHKEAVRFDKEHKKMEIEVIVTLHKLLNQDEKLGRLVNLEEIYTALLELDKIFYEIYEKTEINVIDSAKLVRIDVTRDIITPSCEYTKEIIRLVELSIDKHKSGFRVKSRDELIQGKRENQEWKQDNATFFTYYSEGMCGKVYNKKADITDENTLIDKGLVRFEITLSRKFIKNWICTDEDIDLKKINNIQQLAGLLSNVMADADFILESFITDKCCKGEFLSRKHLVRYIRLKYSTKERRAEKMIEFINAVNLNDSRKIVKDKKTCNIQKYFKELNISYLYSSEQCPYIPSIKSMFSNSYDEKLLNSIKYRNVKKNKIFWK